MSVCSFCRQPSSDVQLFHSMDEGKRAHGKLAYICTDCVRIFKVMFDIGVSVYDTDPNNPPKDPEIA